MSKKDIVKRRKNEVIKEAVIENDQTIKPKQNLSFFIILVILCLFIGILLIFG